MSSASTTLNSEESKGELLNTGRKIVGVKFIKGRSYYLMQTGNQEPECLPVNMVHWDAKDFITELIDMNRKLNDELKIKFIQNRHSPRPFDPLDWCFTDIVHEVRAARDGSWEFLMTFRKPELPPEWRQFEDLSGGSINRLINDLKDDYYRTVGRYKY